MCSLFFQVTATDADGGSFGSISYSLGSGPGSVTPSQFTVGKHNGQICTTTSLDRDQGPANYDFTVTAVDGVSVSAATSLIKYDWTVFRGAVNCQFWQQVKKIACIVILQ